MKKTLIVLILTISGFVSAQAYKGKGDIKFQVGANIQKWGSGISVATDFGIGENMSFGFLTSYLLNTNEGFGVYSEIGFPIAKYKTSPILYENLNNQFVFNIGASFNL